MISKLLITLLLFTNMMFACGTPMASKSPNTPINHVVLLWLKPDTNKNQINKIIKQSEILKSIPGVFNLKIGNPIKSNRAIVDDSFQVALSMSFKSQKELDNYLIHPTHQNFVKKKLKPLSKKIVVYDFKSN